MPPASHVHLLSTLALSMPALATLPEATATPPASRRKAALAVSTEYI